MSRASIAPSELRRIVKGSGHVVVIGVDRGGVGRDNRPRGCLFALAEWRYTGTSPLRSCRTFVDTGRFEIRSPLTRPASLSEEAALEAPPVERNPHLDLGARPRLRLHVQASAKHL